MKKRKGLLLADLHIGALAPATQYNEIKSLFFPRIKKEKPDFIIFLGDFFDHKASLNDKVSYYSFLIVTELLEIAKAVNPDMKIRFVYGTESHEWNQYQIIETMDTDMDIQVIHFAKEEQLFDDLRVLYLPEEHIHNKEEYYQDLLGTAKKYDYIFGHGIIREVMKEAAIASDNQSQTNRAKVPVFSTGELMYACKGQVYFGHYHIHTNIEDDVFYVGSFERWQFGEEEDKGFYVITKKNDAYTNSFVVNAMTPVYKTIHFGYENSIFKDQEIFIKKLDHVDQLIKEGVFDHVRFMFNVPSNIDNPEFIINHIKERYRFSDHVKTDITHGYLEEKKEKEKEEIDKWNHENAPLFDPSIPTDEKVAYFIKLEFQREIPMDHIKQYLYQPLDTILHGEKTDEQDRIEPIED